MKSIKSLTVLIITVLSSAFSTLPKVIAKAPTVGFTKIIVPPIQSNNEKRGCEITVSLAMPKNGAKKVNILFSSDEFPTNKLVYTKEITGTSINQSFSYVFNKSLGWTNARFTFELFFKNKSIQEVSVPAAHYGLQEYEIDGDCTVKCKTPINVYYNGKISQSSETFTFKGFDGFDGNVYGFIDLHSFTFEHKIGNSLNGIKYEEAGAIINDPNGYFKEIGYNQLGNMTFVKMEIVSTATGKAKMQLVDPIFVDPDTLKIYGTSKPGTVQTKRYIYFPKNSANALKDSTILLYITELGHQRIRINRGLKLDNFSKDFGYCQNSKYCVQTSGSSYDEGKGKIIND